MSKSHCISSIAYRLNKAWTYHVITVVLQNVLSLRCYNRATTWHYYFTIITVIIMPHYFCYNCYNVLLQNSWSLPCYIYVMTPCHCLVITVIILYCYYNIITVITIQKNHYYCGISVLLHHAWSLKYYNYVIIPYRVLVKAVITSLTPCYNCAITPICSLTCYNCTITPGMVLAVS